MRTLTALLSLALASAPLLAQDAVVFENARVIIGDGRTLESASFVVTGGRITQVGTSVKAPAGAARVNLTGKTVMPTIVDTHVHLSATREAVEQDLRRRAAWGISGAMSLGQDAPELVSQVRALGTLPGAARFFTAGRGITMPEPGRTQAPYWITSAAEGRKAVQELAAQKVDIVKIWVDDRNGQYKKMTADIYGPIIEEAHKHKLRVTAHLFTLEDGKGLLTARLDAMAHGVRDRDIDDEFMTLVKKTPNLVLVPNLPDRGVKVDMSWLRGRIPDGELQKLEAGNTDRPEAQAAFGIQARNLAKMSSAGVRVALGSDGNNPWAPHVEMADMVASGMTPMQVIVAATRNGAQFVGMTDSGTIEAGRSADFIVLDANPVENIEHTRRISSVYLRGVMVNRP